MSSEAERRALKARLTATARLSRLKRIRKKVYLKEYCLVEQGLYKLKANKKEGSNRQEKEIALRTPVVESLIAY